MFLLLDIGATNIRLSVSVDGKNIVSPQIFPTPQDFNQGMKQIQTVAAQLTGGQKVTAICGGIPGPLNKQKSYVANFPNIIDWDNKPLKETLKQLFNAPVLLENDASLVGLGEAIFGVGQGKKIVAYITVSTGTGGVRVVDGKIDRNFNGFEIGHQIIVPGGNICGCQGLGHLEAYTSGSAIEKIYRQKPENIKDPKIWDEIAKYLSIGINNTIVYWSPEIIILGGGVMKSLPLERVKFHLQEMFTIYPNFPPVEKAALGDNGGLYGGLEYLKQHQTS